MDVRVWFLHNSLKLSLLYNSNLVRGTRHEVMLLIDELGCLKVLLEEAYTMQNSNETFPELEKRLIDAVNEIENTMDTHIMEPNYDDSQPGIMTCFCGFSSSKSTNPTQQVRSLREKKLKSLMEEFQSAVTQIRERIIREDKEKYLIAKALESMEKGTTADAPESSNTVIDDTRKEQRSTVHAPESSDSVALDTRKPREQKAVMDVSFGLLQENLAQLKPELIRGYEDELGLLDGELSMLKDLLEKVSRKDERHTNFDSWKDQIRDAVRNMNEIIGDTWSKKDIDFPEEVKNMRLTWVKPLFDTYKKFSTVVAPDASGTIVGSSTFAPNVPDTVAAEAIVPDTPDRRAAESTGPDTPNKIAAEAIVPDAPDTVVNVPAKNVADADIIRQKVASPVGRERNVLVFAEDQAKLIAYLMERKNELDVISIAGMPGVGKSRLADMIFRDTIIQDEFEIRIWVCISQVFNRRNVFLQILRSLNTRIDDMEQKSDEDLGVTVYQHLYSRRFLIVMDDLWSTQDWDELKIFLPSPGKVLITTRALEVASHASRGRRPHMLRFLSDYESWQLLKLKVFGNEEIPSELESVGRKIAQECKGLPLAIFAIGSVLASVGLSMEAWESVYESVGASLTFGDINNTMETIIALSYDKLPYHLKACFLYLGVFPEDYEIPVRKLTRMWVAEGLVQHHQDGFSYEETAERYLEELINRSLIQPDKVGRDGKVKTCRIHDILHDFCIAEGEKEKSLQHQRCIHNHADILKFLSSIPPGPGVRTFVSISEEEVELTKADASAIPSAYKLLRVLESKPLIFPLIPSNMFQLVHLRYITLSLARVNSTLPQAFSMLSNLQTLIVHTISDTLEVKADISEMTQLRHFETNATATLPTKGKSPSVTQLQTLGRVSPESLTRDVILKIRNVKNLSIHGKLALLLGSKNVSFNNLEMLDQLEKLKLLNDASQSQGQLLLSAFRFPSSLKSLTLSKTFFVWEYMSILCMLPNLRILKLKENAFVGEIWELGDEEFPRLEVLQIQGVNLSVWEMSSDSFPCLRQLELKACKNLKMIPEDLAYIETLEVLDLYDCEAAADSAMEIKKSREDMDYPLQLSISHSHVI